MPVVPYTHRAQPSTLTLGASMPCGARRVPGQGSSEPTCVSTSGVVINDGDDIASSTKVRILQSDHPRRWRGPALCAPRVRSGVINDGDDIPPAGDKRGRTRHFYESVAFDQEPDVRIHLVDDGKLPFLNEFGENVGVVARKRAAVFLDHHNAQRGEAQLTYNTGGSSSWRASHFRQA